MINQLTKYLLQYRTVSIPHVGTIQIIHHSPQINPGDNTIPPPGFSASLKEEENVSEHQLIFLTASLKQERATVLHSLNELGQRISSQMQEDGFDWKGIGFIRRSNKSFAITNNSLAPVSVERVARDEVQHKVLMGEKEVVVKATSETPEETTRKKYPIYLLVGWILLFLSIVFIVVVLFTGGFHIRATGSKQGVQLNSIQKQHSE